MPAITTISVLVLAEKGVGTGLTRLLNDCDQRIILRMIRKLGRQGLNYRSFGMRMARWEMKNKPV